MIKNTNIRNIGSVVKRRKLPANIVAKIEDVLGEGYPVECSTYRLGDLVMLFPMKQLPSVLMECDWGIATDVYNNTPLALFPDIDSDIAYTLRCYLCTVATAPTVFYHRQTRKAYLAYMHHDWTIGAWFSIAAHDFVHGDTV